MQQFKQWLRMLKLERLRLSVCAVGCRRLHPVSTTFKKLEMECTLEVQALGSRSQAEAEALASLALFGRIVLNLLGLVLLPEGSKLSR